MIKVKPLLVSVAVLAALPGLAQAQSLEERIRQLESQIGVMETTPGQGAGGTVELYGSLRTMLQYVASESDSTDDTSTTDVADAASRIGIRASSTVGNGWTVAARGEWKVLTGSNANFGDGRLAYVSIAKEGLGTVAIGQQWSGFYNFIGSVTDVANDGTPGEYPGPFRVDNMVTYANKFGPLEVQLDTSFDGEDSNDLDRYAVSGGVTVLDDQLRLAASYDVRHGVAAGGENIELVGVAAAYNLSPFYVGFSYVTEDNGSDVKPSVIDLSGTYSFGKNALIGHYYLRDADVDDADTSGFLVSIQHQMNDQMRLWADLRLTDADVDSAKSTTLSLGARYDFSITN